MRAERQGARARWVRGGLWVLTCAGMALLGGRPEPAQARFAAQRGPYQLRIEGEHGQRLRSFRHRNRSFVLGRYGQRYAIRVFNRSARRVEAVVSVDGRDVVTGDLADFRRHRGYLIAPYSSVKIEGFRRSKNQVAAFRFTRPADSYSARRGSPQHVGVIGVAIFPERRALRRPRPVQRLPMGAPAQTQRRARKAPQVSRRSRGSLGGRAAPAASAADSTAGQGAALDAEASMEQQAEGTAPRRARDNLGTRYGEDRHSPVRHVRFRRAHRSQPRALLQLRYDDRAGLIARGITIRPLQSTPRRRAHRPEAWPAAQRYAPPPPGY